MNHSNHPRAHVIREQVAVIERHLADARRLHAQRAVAVVDDPGNQTLHAELESLEIEIGRHEKNITRLELALKTHAEQQTAAALAAQSAASEGARTRATQMVRDRVKRRAKVIDKLLAQLRAEFQGLEDDDTTLHRLVYDGLKDVMAERTWRSFDIGSWTRLAPGVVQPLREAISARWFHESSFEAEAEKAADRLIAKIGIEVARSAPA